MAQSTQTSTTIFVVDHSNAGPRPMCEEYEQDNQWLVESILATRRCRGKTQYLVSWKGAWSVKDKTSWESAENIGKDLLQDLKASGIILPSAPDEDGYLSDSEDEDEMDLSDDSGSEYDPDDDDDMDMSDDEIVKPSKAKLPKKSSNTSGDATPTSDDATSTSDELNPTSDQHSESSVSSRSSVTASQAEAIREMHTRALEGAALQAQTKAGLKAEDALWELHGDTITLPVPDSLRHGPAMMQPAPQQPHPSSMTGLFPTSMPAVHQPVQAPTVSQTGFVSNSLPTIDDDAFMNDIFDFRDFIESHEEDAEGSVISEGEQARYDAMSSFSRM